MKKIMFVTLIAFTIGTAQAAKYKTIPSANSSNNSSSMNYSTHNNSGGFKFEARPGLGTVNSTFTFGASLEGKYGFNMGSGNNLFVGLESGFYHASASTGYEGVSASANMIPIETTTSFEFPVSRNIKLSGGVSLGIAIISAGASYDSKIYGDNVVSPPSQTFTKFIWSARPGMVLNDTFVASLPLGTVDGSFYFLPSIGARF